jgi:hypothetical protein
MSQEEEPVDRRLRPPDFLWVIMGLVFVFGGMFVLPRLFDL